MWKMLPLIMFCSLSQPAVFQDIVTGQLMTLQKYERVQIIEVRADQTLVYKNGVYYRINSNKLYCR